MHADKSFRLQLLARLTLLMALLTMALPGHAAPLASVLPVDESPAGAATSLPADPISLQSDARSDSDIAQRLTQVYANVDGLSAVQVEVNSGVVSLSGEVISQAARDQAVALARRVAGVVDVRDRIVESRDVRTRLYPTIDRLRAQLLDFVTLLPLIGIVLVIVLVFWWLARVISVSNWFASLFRGNAFLRDLARRVIRIAVISVGLLLGLEILDASAILTTLLGAAGVVGLAVGFALRDTVENYIASLLLSLRQPFAHNDLVDIEGCEGRVVRLTPRATILMTPDGNHTRIPNAKVYKAIIVNYTRNPKRRFQFDVGVDTAQNLAEAQQLATGTLTAMAGVLDDPAPACTVQTLGDSNVILRVFGWVDQSQAEFLKVRSEAIRLVKRAFDDAGIVMPEPIYNLRLNAPPPAMAGTAPARSAAPLSPAAGAGSDEPMEAIGIKPEDHLDRQIAADRSAADQDDLLSSRAPKE